MPRAVVAFGSNLDAERHLRAGLRALKKHVTVTGLSRVYRTPPWGVRDQPDFLNAVATIETALEPLPLLELLLKIEAKEGRVRDETTVRWGPRPLDLDLLLYEDVLMDSEWLTLPHPRLHERLFVLVPLCDLMPDAVHPRLGKTYRELMDALPPETIAAVDFALEHP